MVKGLHGSFLISLFGKLWFTEVIFNCKKLEKNYGFCTPIMNYLKKTGFLSTKHAQLSLKRDRVIKINVKGIVTCIRLLDVKFINILN